MKRWLLAIAVVVVLALGYFLYTHIQTEGPTIDRAPVEEAPIEPEPVYWPSDPIEHRTVDVVLAIAPFSDQRLAFEVGAYVPASVSHWPDPRRVVYDQAQGEVVYHHDTGTSSLLKFYRYDDTVSVEENLLRQKGQYEDIASFDEELFRELCTLETRTQGAHVVYRLDYDRAAYEAALEERFPNEGYYVSFFCGYFPYFIVGNLLIADMHSRQDATEPRVLTDTVRLVP